MISLSPEQDILMRDHIYMRNASSIQLMHIGGQIQLPGTPRGCDTYKTGCIQQNLASMHAAVRWFTAHVALRKYEL
jgi:hypothetical protein